MTFTITFEALSCIAAGAAVGLAAAFIGALVASTATGLMSLGGGTEFGAALWRGAIVLVPIGAITGIFGALMGLPWWIVALITPAAFGLLWAGWAFYKEVT